MATVKNSPTGYTQQIGEPNYFSGDIFAGMHFYKPKQSSSAKVPIHVDSITTMDGTERLTL